MVGKKRRNLAKIPEIKKIKIPAAIIPPYIYPGPKVLPICCRGATYSTAHPKTTGKPIPVHGVRLICNKVAIPHIKMSAEIKYVICLALNPKAPPTKSGTKISPEYIANKCCNPKIAVFITACCFAKILSPLLSHH